MISRNKKPGRGVHNTHNECIHHWNEERELEKRPQPTIEYNRKYYQRTKDRSLVAKAVELIKEKQRKQRFNPGSTVRDVEASFYKKRMGDEKARKTVTFEDLHASIDRQREVEEMLQSEDWTRRLCDSRKYKYYFLDSLREGHPRYSPYRMFHYEDIRRPVLSAKPYLKIPPIVQRGLKLHYNYPRTPRASQMTAFESAEQYSPRFTSEFTPSKSAHEAAKYNAPLSTRNRSIYSPAKRTHTQSSPLKSRRPAPSKQQLREILHDRTEQLIQFFMGLIEKQ